MCVEAKTSTGFQKGGVEKMKKKIEIEKPAIAVDSANKIVVIVTAVICALKKFVQNISFKIFKNSLDK